MEVILLRDVDKVGLRGEVVNVARGFMRNYLEPRRLAETATPAKVAELEKRETTRARHEARTFEQAQEIAATLSQTELRFDVNAGPQGTLFGSVTPTDIADELWATKKIRVDRRKIDLAEPIKRIGRYTISIEVFQDVNAEVRTLVVPEGGELPPEEELAAMEAAVRAEEEQVSDEAVTLLEGDEEWSEELLAAEEEADLEAATPVAEAEAEAGAGAEAEAGAGAEAEAGAGAEAAQDDATQDAATQSEPSAEPPAERP